jgi:hypothetical protein
MESATKSKEVRGLYDRLRDCIDTNNQAGIEEACRELLRAGRPLAEIVGRGAPASNEFKSSEPKVLGSSLYYWGQQWAAGPDMTRRSPKLVTNHTIGSDTPIEPLNRAAADNSEPDVSGSSREDWVQEWRARQDLPHTGSSLSRQSSEMVNGRDTLDKSSSITSMAGETSGPSQNPPQNAFQRPRRSSIVLPILVIGAVGVVSISLFLLVYLGGEQKLLSIASGDGGPSPTIIAEDSPGTRGLTERSPPAPRVLPAEPNASASGSVTEAANAPTTVETESRADTEPRPLAIDVVSSPTSPRTSVMIPDPSMSVPAADSPFRVQVETTQALAKIISTSPNEVLPTVTAITSPPASERAAAVEVAPPDTLEESRLSMIDTQTLLARGDTLFGNRDINSARLFYERAADAGSAEAAIRLGETFDPVFLALSRLTGVRGDPAVAVKWYRRARDLGASEADVLLRRIE